MSTSALLNALRVRGFECDRKTLADNIKALNAAGFEVMASRKRSKAYYVSDRVFDNPEIRILLDAVQAATFITDKKSEELCSKIAGLAGRRGAEILRQNTVAFNITKTTNEYVYYSVSMISDAIKERKKIAFDYFDYDCAHNRIFRGNGKKYIVNPFATVFSDDKYYMIFYHDNHENMAHYRVDRM
ncbi:MAG: WYL domain-containing protein, partial [Clostridiales bacterium]|nr:WYL domain-containing protein [Clostridiales bacterium]